MLHILKPYLKKHRWELVLYYIMLLAESCLILWLPLLVSHMLNLGNSSGTERIVRYALLVIVLLVATLAEKMLLAYIPNKIGNEMLGAVMLDASHADLKRLYESKRVESFYAMNNMTYFVPFYYLVEFPLMCISIVKMVAIIGILCSWYWEIALILVALVSMQYAGSRVLLNKMYRTGDESEKEKNAFQQSTFEGIKNYKNILGNSMQQSIVRKMGQNIEHLLEAIRKNAFWKSLYETYGYIFNNGLYLLAVVILYNLIRRGQLLLGNYEIILSYVVIMLECIDQFFEVLGIRNITKMQYDIFRSHANEAEHNGEFYEKGIHEIEAKRISFAYGDHLVISNFSQRFTKGKLYVIKGENGAGKSTFINLILGLLSPKEGSVLINGKDLTEWDKYRYLQHQVAVSDQKNVLFFDTLMENIVEQDDADENLYREVLADAGITYLEAQSDNGEYSGGETQKIGFARMLYKLRSQTPSVLIMDEPTNHLDEEGKEVLYRFLQEEKPDRICIVISHDLRLIRMADEVVSL